MSPEEIELLQNVGITLIADIAKLFCISLLSGIYVMVAYTAISTIIKHNRRDKSIWILLAFLCIVLAITVSNAFAKLIGLILFVRAGLVDLNRESLEDQLSLASEAVVTIARLESVLGGVDGLLILAGDVIVVWRAWGICSTKRKLVFLPMLSLLCSLALVIAGALLDSSTSTVVPTTSAYGIVLCIGLPISLFTNVTATTLIGYQLYVNMRTKQHFSKQLRNVTANRILLMLTESGILYCIIQIVAIALNLPDNNSGSALDYAAGSWMILTGFASAIYPSLIILIAQKQGAAAHRCSMEVGKGVMMFETGISTVFPPSSAVLGDVQVELPDSATTAVFDPSAIEKAV